MNVGSYGTIRRGQALHHAVEGCDYLGTFHCATSSLIMIQTSSFFPAVIRVSMGTRARLEQRLGEILGIATHPVGPPLFEMYRIHTQQQIDQLDMIEGVPTLYQRSEGRFIAVAPDDSGVYTPMEPTAYNRATDQFAGMLSTNADMVRIMGCFYSMPADNDWLGGCSIIYNGDFVHPETHPDFTWSYSAESEEEASSAETLRRRVWRDSSAILAEPVPPTGDFSDESE